MVLAGMGHDLIEDTKIGRKKLSRDYGEVVLSLIQEVTNPHGDKKVGLYVEKLRTKGISDSALLIKLADITENALNASYAVHENGVAKTQKWLTKLMLPQYRVLRKQECRTMPESARLLGQLAEFALEAMRTEVDRHKAGQR